MKNLLVTLSVLFTTPLRAQVESIPCESANDGLMGLFQNGSLHSLFVNDCHGSGLHELCSSFLMPSGTPPEIIEDPTGLFGNDDTEYVSWTCRYAPGNLQDGDHQTAWVEGVEGYGIGEVVFIPCLDLKKPVEIWAGFGKSPDLFKFNSRPRKVNVAIVKGKFDGGAQTGFAIYDLEVIKKVEVDLIDTNGFQPLSIPNYEAKEGDDEYYLGIQILDVYKGSKWEDTCISEIRNTE